MKNFYWEKSFKKLLGCLILVIVAQGPVFAELPATSYEQVEHDPYGVWLKSRSYKKISKLGARVVFLPDEKNFFAYWIPPSGAKGKRVVISIHGTGGNPYEELKDELPMAKKFDYVAVAVNWFSPKRNFFSAQELYRNILVALNFIQNKYGNDLSAVAYIGFSRGAAISYEVAHLDSQGENIFDLIIAHSGGIPRNLKVEARNPNAKEDHFFYQLVHGGLGVQAFHGENFFLYSGDLDESWGAVMSDQMEYARDLIQAGGGKVVHWIRDPSGRHAGLRQNRSINEAALQAFILLTPQS